MPELSGFLALKPYAKEFSSLGEEYIFSRFVEPEIGEIAVGPYRVEGMLCMVGLSGKVDLDINLNHYQVLPGSLLVIHPDTLIHLHQVEKKDLDCYVLYLSLDFLKNTNFDLNLLQRTRNNSMFNLPPVLQMEEKDARLMDQYLQLMHANTLYNTDPMYVRSISRCIIAAMFYQMMQIALKECEKEEKTHNSAKLSRSFNYTREFMSLLQEHHRKQRSLGFYASKLCISPRYLSIVVRKTTGRTASRWIEEYVILEAKNMLRYAEMSVQQVSVELNFADQSSFGKYFKNVTGYSPKSYKKL